MRKQTIQFATVTKNGVVQKVGKSTIYNLKPQCENGSINWYNDKPKKKEQDK